MENHIIGGPPGGRRTNRLIGAPPNRHPAGTTAPASATNIVASPLQSNLHKLKSKQNVSTSATETSRLIKLWQEIEQLLNEGPPTVNRTSHAIAKLIAIQRLLESIAEGDDIDAADRALVLIQDVETAISCCMRAKDIALRSGFTLDDQFTFTKNGT